MAEDAHSLMSDYEDPALRKHKRGEPVDEDAVDLEALAQDYENRYGERRRPQAAERLGLDEFMDDMAEKRKNAPRPARPASDALDADDERFASSRGYSRPRVPSAKPTARGRSARDFGKQVEDFFKQPHDPAYRADVDEYATAPERNVAALAHLSAWLTIPAGVFSAGIAVPLMMLIPLLIYLSNRDKSPFLARHALQAFAAQLTGTLGWVAVVIGSMIMGIVATIALAITLVGIIAIPFLWIAIVLFWLATLAMPLGMLGSSVLGALNAVQGKSFDYPYVGRWVNRHEYER